MRISRSLVACCHAALASLVACSSSDDTGTGSAGVGGAGGQAGSAGEGGAPSGGSGGVAGSAGLGGTANVDSGDDSSVEADAGTDQDSQADAGEDASTGTLSAPTTGTTYELAPTQASWIPDPYSSGAADVQFDDGTFFGAGARDVWTRAGSLDRIKYYPDVVLGAGTYTWATYVSKPGGAPPTGDSVVFANFLYSAAGGDEELDFECGWGDGTGQWRDHVQGITDNQVVCGMSAQALNPATQCWAALELDRWNEFKLVLTPNTSSRFSATWLINGATVCGPLDTGYADSTTFHAILSVENLTWMGEVTPPSQDNHGYWDWFNHTP